LLKSRKFKQEVIESWEGGYRLNPNLSFAHVKPESADLENLDKIQILILKSLNLRSKSTDPWVSRADLVELTKSSDSTIKRELAKLILASRVIRKGEGPSVVYALSEIQ
jgi:hypothetical protein